MNNYNIKEYNFIGELMIKKYNSIKSIILPNKKAHVRVFDLKANYEERNQIQDLEPIGDAYWAEYRYHSTSRCRDLLPVCKIHEYEKWFGKS